MSIHYPFGTQATLGQPVQVCDGVYRFSIPLPEHLSLGHINAWILADGDGWTLVESGFGCDEARQAWQQVHREFLGDKPVKQLILTHHHIDHAGLCHWLQQLFQTQVWVSSKELQYMVEFHDQVGLWGAADQQVYFDRLDHDAREKAATLEFLRGTAAGMGPLPEQPQLIESGHYFQIDGRQWQVIKLKGHAPDQCTLFCQELNVWIGSDQLLPKLSTYAGMEPGDLLDIDTLAQLDESLEQVVQLPADVLVLPAHGAPFTGIVERSQSVRRNYQRLSKQLLECCATLKGRSDQGVSVMEIRRKLIPDSLFYSSPFFVTAKVASTLRHMGNRGMLQSSFDDQGRLLYRLKTA